MIKRNMIQISPELHSYLASHGQFGERFEDIIVRLIGVDKLKAFTEDRDTKVYSKDDVDSRKTKKRRGGK